MDAMSTLRAIKEIISFEYLGSVTANYKGIEQEVVNRLGKFTRKYYVLENRRQTEI